MQVREITSLEFEHFTNNYNVYSFYQTIEYANAMKTQNFGILFLGLIDEKNNILAASLILVQKLFGFKYAYAPRGFLVDYNNFHQVEAFTIGVKKILGRKDIIALKMNPLIIKSIYDNKNKVVATNSYYDKIFQNLKKIGFYHLGYNNYFEAFKPRFEAIIDINIPYYILFKDLKKEFKTKIRSVDRKGVKIYKGTINDLHYLSIQTENKYPRNLKYFQDMYLNFDQKQNIEFYYAKLDTEIFLKNIQNLLANQEQITTNINATLGAKNSDKLINKKINADNLLAHYKNQLILATKLLKENPEGIITAAGLIVKNKDEIYLLMDGFDSTYKFLSSKHLLIWKLMEKYSKQGFKKFNLGGMSNYNLENNKYKQLNEFKFGFNAKGVEYIGDLEVITNQTLYFIYRNSAPIRGILKR
ncbi:MAG: peptidoglycan bridge formation glycyltransferase FemA/FemB family protein [Bacilli bacterium]